MNREVHVRICESLGVKFPGATRQTSTSTDMVRRYARGPRGERVIGYAPGGHRKTMTFIAGLRRRGMTAPAVIDGAMTGPMFVGYIEQVLAPTLKRGEFVCMDNASVHKVVGVREAIEAVGAHVLYLPSYSPDLNPIEMAFSKLKALLRAASERTVPGLTRLIGKLIKEFSPKECKNYRSCWLWGLTNVSGIRSNVSDGHAHWSVWTTKLT